MVDIHRWCDKGFFLSRLERHGDKIYVVVYYSKFGPELGQADAALQKNEPTLADLQEATSKILGLSRKKRFAYSDSITGAITFSRDKQGFVTEHIHLFNKNFGHATGDELLQFLSQKL